MFKKEEEKTNFNKEAETVIGPSIKVKGNFHGEGNIIIEGSVEGSIKTSGNLYLGDKAKIFANIEAKEARIGGEINGNIKIEGYLEISEFANITGDIEASSISIAKGAIFNGNCVMGGHKKNTSHQPEKDNE